LRGAAEYEPQRFLNDEGDTERHEDLRGGLAFVKSPQHDPLENDGERRHGERRYDEARDEARALRNDEPNVGAHRIESAVRKIHQAQHPKDDGEPDGDRDVDQPKDQSVERGLEQAIEQNASAALL